MDGRWELVAVALTLCAGAVIAATLTSARVLGRRTPLWWWLRARPAKSLAGIGVAAAATLILGTGVIGAVLAFTGTRRITWAELDERCEATPLGCNVVVELGVTLFLLGVAFTTFMLWRRRRIAGYYRRLARTEPEKLLRSPTTIDDIVSRVETLEVVGDDISRADHRRPHVIVGGTGSGKSTTLMELTRWLADRGAIPVPLSLDGPVENLSFLALAKQRFLEVVDSRLLSEDQGDRIWRKLCGDRMVVVLADALEAVSPPGTADRGAAIRYAIDSAQDDQVALVIASRPMAALARLNVAIVELEALKEADVTTYLLEHLHPRAGQDAQSIDELVRIGRLAETPYFVRVAAELATIPQLPAVPAVPRRSALRLVLLDAYTDALIDGHLQADVNLLPSQRAEVIAGLEIVALKGFIDNRARVDLEDLDPAKSRLGGDASRGWDPDLICDGSSRLGLTRRAEVRTLEFRQTILQAYLASRLVARRMTASGRDELRPVAAHCTREGFMALVLAAVRAPGEAVAREIFELLLEEAEQSRADQRIYHATAAADVIEGTAGMGFEAGDSDRFVECAMTAGETRTRLPKLRVIPRLARLGTPRACEALWNLCQDDDYAVRLSAATSLGEGGAAAFATLRRTAVGTLRQEQAGGRASGAKYSIRQVALQGWILPTLASTCEGPAREEVLSGVERWAGLVGRSMHPGIEASIAQGFKLEAGRVLDEDALAGRQRLWTLATSMLGAARFWYSKIALLHAVCLWAVADAGRDEAARKVFAERLARERHPFVRETIRLCVAALEACDRQRPLARRDVSSFLWFDEIAVIGTGGGTAGQPIPGTYWAELVQGTAPRTARIPMATSWAQLGARASQLVADLVILLNLIEQGDAGERRRRLERACVDELPRCLSEGDRSELAVSDSGAPRRELGSGCTRGCGFGYCPYPPKAERPFRGDLTEAFCRRQRQLLRLRRKPAWQHVRRARLRSFWSEMESRVTD